MSAVSSRRALLLLAAFTVLWFGALQPRRLVTPDEGRYAEIAREMAAGGSWITPRLDGLKYFEKPPLQYWATAVAFKTFGEREWTARLWTGLTGYLCVLLVFYTGKRLYDERTGLLAALVAGSSFLIVALGHYSALDMGLTFFLQLALSGFMLAQRAPPGSAAARRWMLLAWAAAALAVLSKGPVALVLPGGALVVYSLACRDAAPWRRLEWARGVPLLLLIAAPWFVAVSFANPHFAHFFFIHEHVERFLTRIDRRYQPWWFFVPVLLAGALPWTLTLPQAVAAAWRRPEQGFHSGRFLVAWSALVFVFFSVSHSKLPSYILPIMPALALVCGAWLRHASARAVTLHLGAIALIAAAAALTLPQVSHIAGNDARAGMMAHYMKWIEASATIWLAGSLAAAILAWKRHPVAALALFACAACVAETGILLGHDTLNRTHSAYYIARQIGAPVPADVPFYSVGSYDQTLPFYLNRTVTLVDYRDEFAFGLEREPDKGIASLDEFERRWNAAPSAYAYMKDDMYNDLRAAGVPMRVVARDPENVIVRKP